MIYAFKLLSKLLLALVWIATWLAGFGLVIGLCLELLEIESVFSRTLPSWSAWTYLAAIAGLSAVQYPIAKVLEPKESATDLRSPWIN
jgi:hypothetical protein